MRIASDVVALGVVSACTTGDPTVQARSTNLPAGSARTPSGAPPSQGGSAGGSPAQEQDGGANAQPGDDGSTTTPPPPPSSDAGDAPPAVDAGGPPPNDDAGGPPPPPPPLDQCNAVTQAGAATTLVYRVATYDRSQLTGGAIADGTYVLTQVTDYVEPSHVDGSTAPYGSETLVVHGGVMDDVFAYPAGDSVRFTASLVASGSLLRMTTSCTWEQNANAHFPATYDWSALEHDDDSFGATPTTLTTWTPRGNHESVVRVYTKLP